MSDPTEWSKLLHGHPIFSLPDQLKASTSSALNPLELSTTTLPNFTKGDAYTPSGRRQVMLLKDTDLIVASGKELRISAFGDLKLSHSVRKTYKTLHTPAVDFDIHQISINPSGKLLAVAGATSVAVVVLPRGGYSRMVSDLVECRAVQIGQYYHSMKESAPIAKIDWHPWGDAGSTLLVMTVDGKLREYDISVDTEEPQQVLSFVNEQRSATFNAIDASEREVASFTLGSGRADWGPLTVYAIMRSGDIYSICPYLPQNASVPATYVHSLERFISHKQDAMLKQSSTPPKDLSTIYDYQHKFVAGLVKQMPPNSPSTEHESVLLHPPRNIKAAPLRRGPYLLQPSPRILEGSEGGDATDITYISFPTSSEDEKKVPEHLGVILASYQDGRVDLFLDVDKVEGSWNFKPTFKHDSPMLAVYESIDLGLIKNLGQATAEKDAPLLDLLEANHPLLLLDPLHNDMVYVYHAFGVHSLDLAPVIQTLSAALHDESPEQKDSEKILEDSGMTKVTPILNTFSVKRKCSNPVIGVNIPNDVYISYGIFILTSSMRILPLALASRATSVPAKPQVVQDGAEPVNPNKWLTPPEGPSIYVTLNAKRDYEIKQLDLPKLPKPPSNIPFTSKEWFLSKDTFTYLGETIAYVNSQQQVMHSNLRKSLGHCTLLETEKVRQVAKCKEMEALVEKMKVAERAKMQARISTIQEKNKALLARLDRILQAYMEKASPVLSEHETRWFEELKRMKQDVLGRARYDEDSLVSKTRLLEKEYARILPPLQALAAKQALVAQKHAESAQSLGFTQAFDYGQRSNTDRTKISEVEKQLTKLAANLQISLPRPPQA